MRNAKNCSQKIKSVRADRASSVLVSSELSPILGRSLQTKIPVTAEEKIALFSRLFRCREEIFPKRGENKKNGRAGYSPVCENEWVKPICRKLENKIADCKYQSDGDSGIVGG